jgi:hypothetical protein
MANTYELISSVTVGSGGAADIDFTSIPSTYTDLLIKFSLRDNFAGVYDNLVIRFNNITTNYSERNLYSNGSTAASASTGTTVLRYINGNTSTSNTFGNGEMYIPNYAGSTNKSASIDTITENNGTEAWASLNALLWSNTSAITSVKLTPSSGTLFLQYSTATLYGISNA